MRAGGMSRNSKPEFTLTTEEGEPAAEAAAADVGQHAQEEIGANMLLGTNEVETGGMHNKNIIIPSQKELSFV